MKRRSCASSGGLSTFRLVRLSEPVLALTHPGIIAALTSVFLMKIRQHVFAHAIVGSVTPRGSEIFGIHSAANGAAVGVAIGAGQGPIGGAGGRPRHTAPPPKPPTAPHAPPPTAQA